MLRTRAPIVRPVLASLHSVLRSKDCFPVRVPTVTMAAKVPVARSVSFTYHDGFI